MKSITSCCVAISPRVFELTSVILVSSGINVLTNVMGEPSTHKSLIGGASFVLSGSFLFFLSASIEEAYKVAEMRFKVAGGKGVSISERAVQFATADDKRMLITSRIAVMSALFFGLGLASLLTQ